MWREKNREGERDIDYMELAHVIMEADKSWDGQSELAGNQKKVVHGVAPNKFKGLRTRELMVQFKPECRKVQDSGCISQDHICVPIEEEKQLNPEIGICHSVMN